MTRSPSAILATVFLALTLLHPALAQTDATVTSSESPGKSGLTKFDLDFPGGTPQELVSAMQKAMGRPLNVVIPTPYAEVRMPPLIMKHVDAAQLFRALTSSSPTTVTVPNSYSYRMSYAFRTDGSLSDDSVWYFTADLAGMAGEPQRSVRFFNLTPYLDQGLTVDDITTAIQTGWKMAGDSTGCELSYHKETKLLIVVGNSRQFETVNNALQALTQQINSVLSAFLKDRDEKRAKAAGDHASESATDSKKTDK
jgi:hypothetical protein